MRERVLSGLVNAEQALDAQEADPARLLGSLENELRSSNVPVPHLPSPLVCPCKLSRIGFGSRADKSGIENYKPKHLPPAEAGVPPVILSPFGGDWAKFYKNHYARAAGGFFSRAGDLLTFGRMILKGGEYAGKRYLSEAAMKEMVAHRHEYPGDFGVAWTVQSRDNGPSTAGSFGHHGARGSVIWIDPGKGSIMVFLMQGVDLKGKELDDIKHAFFNAARELTAISGAKDNAE